MASVPTCEFDESLSKMSQHENNIEVSIENTDQDDLGVNSDIQKEDKTSNETDLTGHQFSNNATSLGIPVTQQSEYDSVIDSKPDVSMKDTLKESQEKNLNREEADVPSESCTDSPGVTSQEDDTTDDTDYIESAGDERIACIEEEYIQRISLLERRHSELENVLERLTAAVECCLVKDRINKGDEEASHDSDSEENADKEEGATKEPEPEKIAGVISRSFIIELFVEFQQKIRNFAEELNGVLNCSEAAIRHARVVQEWATSVQLMFEELKEERHKILGYIDERERNMLIVKEQFVAELEEQGKTLKQLVEEMMSHHELQQQGEDYCKTKGESSSKRSTVEKIVDLLLKRRLEEDKSIILNLNKQSKISEMKLFIIHQQSCIQQLQEQNKELRAIIEGLMGPDDLEEEDPCDTDQTGTPASVTNQEESSVRGSLLREESPSISLVSDVLYCDRGEYLPGNSTDGDLATVKAYNIGADCSEIKSGEEIVFDPLSVNYVREQCQHAEESERQAHLDANNPEKSDQVDEEKDKSEQISGEQDEGPQLSSEQEDGQQLSSEQDEVPQPSAEQDEIPEVSSEQEDVPHVSNEQEDVPQVSSEHDDVPQVSSEQEDVPHVSSEQEDVPHVPSEHDDVPQVSSEQEYVPQVSSEQDEIIQVSNEQDEVQHISAEQNEVQQLSNLEKDSDAHLHETCVEPCEDIADAQPNIVNETGKDNASGDSVDIAVEKGASFEQTTEPQNV